MFAWIDWSIVSTRSFPRFGGFHDGCPARDLVALRVALDPHLTRAAAQALLVERLEAAEPVVVGADETEHRRGEQARRVEALRLGDEGDAVQVQRLDPRHRGVVDLAGHVRELAAGLGELGFELGLADDRSPSELGRFAALARLALGERGIEYRGYKKSTERGRATGGFSFGNGFIEALLGGLDVLCGAGAHAACEG